MTGAEHSDLYVWIPNWDGPDGFQHYKGRDPIWIKNYTRLLAKDEYLALSSHRRGVLHGIWLAYASSNRRLRADARSLSSRLQVRVTSSDLVSLNHAGFIDILASKALAKRLQPASKTLASRAPARSQEGEEEVERETKPSAVRKEDNEQPDNHEWAAPDEIPPHIIHPTLQEIAWPRHAKTSTNSSATSKTTSAKPKPNSSRSAPSSPPAQ